MLTIRTEFELDCPKAQAWAFMTDAALAVPCFPGAELGALRDDGFYDGSFGVKLGPMALRFGGRFKVEPIDEAAGLLKVQAQGQDTKGRGSAKSDVSCTLADAAGKTLVKVDSKVELAGSIAQFGRAAGMIEVISKQLLLRFATNVKEALAQMPVAVTPIPVQSASQLAAQSATQTAAANLAPNGTATVVATALPPAAPTSAATAAAQPPRSFWRWLTAWFAR